MKTFLIIIYTFLFTALLLLGAYIGYELYFEPKQETQAITQHEQPKEPITPQAELTQPPAETSYYLTYEERAEMKKLEQKKLSAMRGETTLSSEDNQRFNYLTSKDAIRQQMEEQ